MLYNLRVQKTCMLDSVCFVLLVPRTYRPATGGVHVAFVHYIDTAIAAVHVTFVHYIDTAIAAVHVAFVHYIDTAIAAVHVAFVQHVHCNGNCCCTCCFCTFTW